MGKCKLDSLALQETKQLGNERVERGKYIFFKSGGSNKYFNVAFLVTEKYQFQTFKR